MDHSKRVKPKPSTSGKIHIELILNTLFSYESFNDNSDVNSNFKNTMLTIRNLTQLIWQGFNFLKSPFVETDRLVVYFP